MKRSAGCFFFCIVFCVLLMAGNAFAEALSSNLSNLSGMSVEELLSLRDEIDALLVEKGHTVYFDIERGAKGEEVSAIQQRLAELGYYTGKNTGKYDSETQKAFKAFEKANSLKNDGIASVEDQKILFGDAAVEKTKPQTENTEPAQSGKNTDNKIEHDSSFDYEHCLRYPEEHIGEKYTLKGRVEQTLGNRNEGFRIRFAVLGSSEEILFVYINKDPGYNILEKDWLIIDLTMSGTITYESVWNQEITIPSAVASEVTLR